MARRRKGGLRFNPSMQPGRRKGQRVICNFNRKGRKLTQRSAKDYGLRMEL